MVNEKTLEFARTQLTEVSRRIQSLDPKLLESDDTMGEILRIQGMMNATLGLVIEALRGSGTRVPPRVQ